MSDQLIAEAATVQHTEHSRRTSMTSAGFEPSISALKQLQFHVLDRTAAGIGGLSYRRVSLA